MNEAAAVQRGPISKARFWASVVLSAIPVFMLLMSAVMKLTRNPQAVEGFHRYGYADSAIFWIGLTEVICTLVYVFPRTSVFGAILLTGYLGGAVNTHVRAGEIAAIGAITFGVMLWLGLYLREPRLHPLVPVRK